MIHYDKIRRLHIELSTKCNSMCPDCPRNLRGVEVLENKTFPLTQLYLNDIKKILSPDFIRQLNWILFNGNFGDFVTARDGLEIVKYLLEHQPKLNITISTNASARPDIWEELGKLKISVQFRLDGLRDTHHLYRQNTDWDLIISNAKSFIKAGGRATWAMIAFDHNRHQIQQCKKTSEELGFEKFWLIENPPGTRNEFPVFTRDKKFSHAIGEYKGIKDFEVIHKNHLEGLNEPDRELQYVQNHKHIVCKTMTIKNESMGQEIYLCANGEIYPCCWTGFYPGYCVSSYTNKQLLGIVKENNALEYGLEHSIKWFDELVKTWSLPSVEQGRIMACNDMCGHDD